MAAEKTQVAKEDFDFLRFSFPDIHGISKTILVPRCNIQKFWDRGVKVATGALALGPNGEYSIIQGCLDTGYCSGTFKPIPSTLHPVPWAASEACSVGQVLSSWCYITGESHPADPRAIAARLIDTLHKEFGFSIMSAFEYEFMLFDPDSKQPVYPNADVFTTLSISEFEEFLHKTDGYLRKAGIKTESYHTEGAPGQFEIALSPELGIEAMDQAFKFKQSMKEISKKAGYTATFMARPIFEGLGNAGQFNVSLWNNNKNCVFFNPSDKDKMSTTFRHWIAGLIEHTNALSAICCPTINCYRRLHQSFCYKKADWGIDNREACYRVKTYSHDETYLELRFPTAAANPYMVMAAVLAAGLDGLRNNLELPDPMSPDAAMVPQTLDEALDALEQDEVIKEAIGPTFIEWFLQEKRTVEIKTFKTHKMNSRDEEELAAERKMYLISI